MTHFLDCDSFLGSGSGLIAESNRKNGTPTHPSQLSPIPAQIYAYTASPHTGMHLVQSTLPWRARRLQQRQFRRINGWRLAVATQSLTALATSSCEKVSSSRSTNAMMGSLDQVPSGYVTSKQMAPVSWFLGCERATWTREPWSGMAAISIL